MENDVFERLRRVLDEKEISRKKLSELSGLPLSTVTTNISGVPKRPSYDVVEAVLYQFSDISAEWLMRGEGEMYISDIPKDGDTEEVVELKAELTKLHLEIERLTAKVEQVRRERDHAVKERDQLMLDNRAINRRVDKLIDILYQDPATRVPIAADERLPYHADTTLAG